MLSSETNPQQRLQKLSPTIQKICDTAGAAGTSIGVLHYGKILYTENFGYRDVASKTPATSSTIYNIASLTKAMVVAGIGKLVDDGRLQWTTPINTIIPEFQPQDHCIRTLTTVSDLLSHRTGLPGALNLAFQGDEDFLLPPDQLLPTMNKMVPIAPFRTQWGYNNWGYALAGLIIEWLSKTTLEEYLKTWIWGPLGMRSTSMNATIDPSRNIAKPYSTLKDGTPYSLKSGQKFKDSLFEASGAVFTNIDDLLKWANAVLKASISAETPESPLKNIPTILSSHSLACQPSLRERAYALGWVRTQLPGVIGIMGDNAEIWPIDELPKLGTDSPSRLAIYHQGSAIGYFASITLFPETQSAVIVLTNSIALGDTPDWIAQSIIQTLFNFPRQVDYVSCAEKTKMRLLGFYDNLLAELEVGRGPPLQISLDSFTGSYYNSLGNFHIEIQRHPQDTNTLSLLFQGLESQHYNLRHYDENTFEWTLTANDTARRGRYHAWDLDFFKMRFHRSQVGSGHMDQLIWVCDPESSPKGDVFSRQQS